MFNKILGAPVQGSACRNVYVRCKRAPLKERSQTIAVHQAWSWRGLFKGMEWHASATFWPVGCVTDSLAVRNIAVCGGEDCFLEMWCWEVPLLADFVLADRRTGNWLCWSLREARSRAAGSYAKVVAIGHLLLIGPDLKAQVTQSNVLLEWS